MGSHNDMRPLPKHKANRHIPSANFTQTHSNTSKDPNYTLSSHLDLKNSHFIFHSNFPLISRPKYAYSQNSILYHPILITIPLQHPTDRVVERKLLSPFPLQFLQRLKGISNALSSAPSTPLQTPPPHKTFTYPSK